MTPDDPLTWSTCPELHIASRLHGIAHGRLVDKSTCVSHPLPPPPPRERAPGRKRPTPLSRELGACQLNRVNRVEHGRVLGDHRRVRIRERTPRGGTRRNCDSCRGLQRHRCTNCPRPTRKGRQDRGPSCSFGCCWCRPTRRGTRWPARPSGRCRTYPSPRRRGCKTCSAWWTTGRWEMR